MNSKELRCVVLSVSTARVTTIPNTLKALQAHVKGPIEVFKTQGDLVFLCNEDGRSKNMVENPYFCGIVGPVVIVSSDGEKFVSLSDAEIEWIKERIIRE